MGVSVYIAGHVVERGPVFLFLSISLRRWILLLRAAASPASQGGAFPVRREGLATYRACTACGAGQVSPGDLSGLHRLGGRPGLAEGATYRACTAWWQARSRSELAMGMVLLWVGGSLFLLRGGFLWPTPLVGLTVAAVSSRCLI